MGALGFSGYIFDLDGAIYRGEKLISGAKETIEKLKILGKRIVYLSNKPLQTREDYAAKLSRLGIPTEPSEVINSSLVMAQWLSQRARLRPGQDLRNPSRSARITSAESQRMASPPPPRYRRSTFQWLWGRGG